MGMYDHYLKKIASLVLILCIFIILSAPKSAIATISGVHGVQYSSKGDVACNNDPPRIDAGSKYKAKACTLNPSGYVPASGQYRVKLFLLGTNRVAAMSTPAYFDATKNLNQQSVTVSGTDVAIEITSQYAIHRCYMLVDSNNTEWTLNDSLGCSGYTPIPPTPPKPSCSINSGGGLNVDLGTVERASLPTTPGTGQIQHKQISVTCTNESATAVNVNMQLSYTPISIDGKSVIKSSSNGLGVSVIYNNQPLSPTDIKSLQFTTGSNSFDLGFEAVRNPAVAVGDIPTGGFSASAVLTMTVQ